MKKRFLIILLLCSAHFIQPMLQEPIPRGNNWTKIPEDTDIEYRERMKPYIKIDGVSTAINLSPGGQFYQPLPDPTPPAPTANGKESGLLAALNIAYNSSLFVPFSQTVATEATYLAMVYTETDKILPRWTNQRVVNAMSVAGLLSLIRNTPTNEGILGAFPEIDGSAKQKIVFTLETSVKAGAAAYLTEGAFKAVNDIATRCGYGDILNPKNPLTYVAVETAMNWGVNKTYSWSIAREKISSLEPLPK